MPILVIDLFAGPGGLGEGFSSLVNDAKEHRFKIRLSIEKDAQAHQTLELRAFFREFQVGGAPNEYYKYLCGEMERKELFAAFPDEAKEAQEEAWCKELGKESRDEISRRIEAILGHEKKWVLIGGPPCQAYSLVGRSRRKADQDFEKDEKHFLYKEYLRILAVHKPPVFVMENVKGLLSATVKSERIFEQILEDLKHPIFATDIGSKQDLEYHFFPLVATSGEISGHLKPEDFIIRSEQFGIPQARHRIIVIGVRSDWPSKPDLLEIQRKPVNVRQAISDLPALRSGLSKDDDSSEAWRQAVGKILDETWLHQHELEKDITMAVHRIKKNLTRGGKFLSGATKAGVHTDWFYDRRLNGICNHETRGHIAKDLHRYLFAAVFAEVNGRSPLLEDFPKALLPKHENVAEALKNTKFNDRFRVQLADRPSTTVVSHISKDGHYYIHFDPTQCRSLTVREAARLQTFPDNYFFEGPRTEQYKQVGNAVPPLLARQIAEIIAGLFD